MDPFTGRLQRRIAAAQQIRIHEQQAFTIVIENLSRASPHAFAWVMPRAKANNYCDAIALHDCAAKLHAAKRKHTCTKYYVLAIRPMHS